MAVISEDLPSLTELYVKLRETKFFLDQVAEEFIDAESVEMHTMQNGSYCLMVTYDAKRLNRLSKLDKS